MQPDGEDTHSGFSLNEYLAILKRRRAIILMAFVVISVVGVIQALIARNVYQASARMLVEGPSYNLNTVDSSNPLSSLFQLSEQQSVETQVEVLQAAPLMDMTSKLAGQAALSVSVVNNTNVIEVTGESDNPRSAAAAPNMLLQLYIGQDTDQNLSEMERARQFVITQGKEAHKKLVASEDALRNFKVKSHIAVLDKNRDDQIARVNALTDAQKTAQINLITLNAQIAATQDELQQTPTATVLTTQATNPVIASLQESIRTLEVQRVGLIQPGGLTPRAPQVRALDAQIADLRQRLARQPTLLPSENITPSALRQSLREKIADLQAQLPVLRTQLALETQALTDATSKIGKYAGLELTLDQLTRQHDSAQAADKNFQDQLSDLNLREKAHHASARIIESAQVPNTPVRPKRVQSIIFSCLIGLFVGLCLALLQEFLDDRINSSEEADRVLGLPSLGHVPALSITDAHLLPQMKGLDPASESYRVLRTNIQFATLDAPARTLLVTSSNPGEGKTTTATNLAFAMAMDGRTVILVDTDLRRPSLHKLLELPNEPGLTDVLLGRNVLAPREIMPGLSVLTSGSPPPNPGELLNSRKFRQLVEELVTQADVVIFDSPPVLAAADAAILASQMDGTILVVETGTTKKASARRTMRTLQQSRATILGVAHNKMQHQNGAGYYYYYQYGTPKLESADLEPGNLNSGNLNSGNLNSGNLNGAKPSEKPLLPITLEKKTPQPDDTTENK